MWLDVTVAQHCRSKAVLMSFSRVFTSYLWNVGVTFGCCSGIETSVSSITVMNHFCGLTTRKSYVTDLHEDFWIHVPDSSQDCLRSDLHLRVGGTSASDNWSTYGQLKQPYLQEVLITFVLYYLLVSLLGVQRSTSVTSHVLTQWKQESCWWTGFWIVRVESLWMKVPMEDLEFHWLNWSTLLHACLLIVRGSLSLQSLAMALHVQAGVYTSIT